MSPHKLRHINIADRKSFEIRIHVRYSKKVLAKISILTVDKATVVLLELRVSVVLSTIIYYT